MTGEDIRSYSMAELDEMVAAGDFLPTRPDAPEYDLGEGAWQNARIVWPDGTEEVRLSQDVVARFRQYGADYEARINAALREWIEQHDQ